MRAAWLARWLRPRLETIVAAREADYLIGDADVPYLKRWYLVPRNPVFNVYLHLILRSDDDGALHDHPWWSASLMVRGRMAEYYARPPIRFDGESYYASRREFAPGDVTFRGLRVAHRLVPDESNAQPAMTLFVTGPRVREWGFWCRHGWRRSREYSDRENPGEIGRGCD